jgi:hypothetical protein
MFPGVANLECETPDIEFFRSNPRPFFAFAKELFPKSKGFTFVPSRYDPSTLALILLHHLTLVR